jgi:hypothetical protein
VGSIDRESSSGEKLYEFNYLEAASRFKIDFISYIVLSSDFELEFFEVVLELKLVDGREL